MKIFKKKEIGNSISNVCFIKYLWFLPGQTPLLILCQHLSNFVSLVLKLNNCKCHSPYDPTDIRYNGKADCKWFFFRWFFCNLWYSSLLPVIATALASMCGWPKIQHGLHNRTLQQVCMELTYQREDPWHLNWLMLPKKDSCFNWQCFHLILLTISPWTFTPTLDVWFVIQTTVHHIILTTRNMPLTAQQAQ